MKSEREENVTPDWIHYEYDLDWVGAAGRPAGIYWLDGRVELAVHQSPAEDRLLARGAVLVATLRFDPDPLEQSHAGRPVERMASPDVSEAFLLSGVN
jgi:hypothetical protein